ncbi:hypothetical protein CEW91_07900 [Idiomarina piscisalsi]|uniref:DUF6602 domain-containing protein n=1 Tax=Idiomarina piscisalsi TaxID=1096243 RepID=A0ABM6LU21_9GAMM|nr:DUF6602 domain-containing protein [Idiomarina piscisalsi]ASG66075.1 hypothetical protein CEW91_07900 [Idiomarina piscisalsi]
MSDNEFIVKMLEDAAELRKGVFEFQGFEREFLLYQEQLLREYEKSSGLKHPGNRGDAREDYLRNFFSAYGLIPQKYGISSSSGRVVSSSGHHSEELDLLFYDQSNSISLLKYQSSEFYPVEHVHGVIQVKSCFRNKKTVKDGLRNIASFKKLKKSGKAIQKINGLTIESPSTRGFGILFAYKSSLKWLTVINAIKEFMAEAPSTEWPNAVVILDEGLIVPFDGSRGCFQTPDIDKLTSTEIIGRPNNGDCLLSFYSMLMEMLDNTTLGGFQLSNYIRLPLLSGDISYNFSYGPFAEVGNCEKHGQYLREISQEALKKIIDTCDGQDTINWIKALDIAYGRPDDNIEAYERQPGEVHIYNPDDEELKDILVFPNEPHGLAYDSVSIEGKTYWVPYAYSIRDNLVVIECPKCKKA